MTKVVSLSDHRAAAKRGAAFSEHKTCMEGAWARSVEEQRRTRDRRRTEWTLMVAHDLRQPLNTISVCASILARSAEERGQGEPREAQLLLGAVRQMNRLISDLVDASSIEAQRLAVTCVDVSVVALVRDAVSPLSGAVERCQLTIGPAADVLVRADPLRVHQILGNLLANALKYGEPGGEIGVDVTRHPAEVQVTVSNRGQGISAMDLPRIWDRFERVADTRARTSGLGLGLYIARELAEAQGGRIWATSAPGVITQFHFTLPLAASR